MGLQVQGPPWKVSTTVGDFVSLRQSKPLLSAHFRMADPLRRLSIIESNTNYLNRT